MLGDGTPFLDYDAKLPLFGFELGRLDSLVGGEWAYRTAPEDYVRRELREQILSFIGVAALVGMAVVIFCIGTTVLRFCGISVFRAQKSSGADQKS